jgi:hypothetical protein
VSLGVNHTQKACFLRCRHIDAVAPKPGGNSRIGVLIKMESDRRRHRPTSISPTFLILVYHGDGGPGNRFMVRCRPDTMVSSAAGLFGSSEEPVSEVVRPVPEAVRRRQFRRLGWLHSLTWW